MMNEDQMGKLIERRDKVRERIKFVNGGLNSIRRIQLSLQVDALMDLEDALWSEDMGCAAIRVRKAIDILLDQETVIVEAHGDLHKPAP